MVSSIDERVYQHDREIGVLQEKAEAHEKQLHEVKDDIKKIKTGVNDSNTKLDTILKNRTWISENWYKILNVLILIGGVMLAINEYKLSKEITDNDQSIQIKELHDAIIKNSNH